MKKPIHRNFISAAVLFAVCVAPSAAKKHPLNTPQHSEPRPGLIAQIATQQADDAIAALRQNGSFTSLDEERIRDDAQVFIDTEAAKDVKAYIKRDCMFGDVTADITLTKSDAGHVFADFEISMVSPGLRESRPIGALNFVPVEVRGRVVADQCEEIAARTQAAINYYRSPMPDDDNTLARKNIGRTGPQLALK